MRRSIIPLVIAVAVVAGSAATAAAATAPTDLFVGGPGCSDTGSGSQDTPFCTLQAAAAAVLPGQTVHVAHGRYTGDIQFAHSGEPGSPITFVGAGDPRDGDTNSVLAGGADGGGFGFIGVHDINVTGFQLTDSAKVFINHSARIGVEHNVLTGGNALGVVVLGLSSDVTITRNFVSGFTGDGVFVEPGATGTTITTNLVNSNAGRGIDVDDDPGTIITGNTVAANCEGGIALEDAAGGATVENNVVENNDSPAGSTACAGEPQLGELSVSAASTSGTTADYNLVFTTEADPLYDWAGDTFTDPAAFATATGQGTHDIDEDPGPFLTTGSLPTLSPPVDSANSDAPGETAVDINGAPRVDNPLVPNTGVGIDDRGALEAQDPLQVEGVTMSPTKAPVGQSVTASVDVVNPWSTVLSYSFDFGDGTDPVVTSTPSAAHTYDAVGVHTVTVTATTPAGVVKTANPATVAIVAPAPLVADVRAFQTGALSIAADTGASTDSWQITDYAIDFGDGTPVVHTTDTTVLHTYATPGTYTVSTTETDFATNHAGAAQQVTVASGYFPTAPSRVLDTRDGTGVRPGKLGAGGVVSLKLAGTHGIPATGVRAVVLNVTAVSPTAASFLTVYPDGTTRPVASSLNYVAGQTVPNLVTVPVGADGNVDFFNHVGTVDVVADLEGYYADQPASNTGSFLRTVRPQRLLDTRNANGVTSGQPIGAGGVAPVAVNQAGAPANVSAVVLNVTVTAPTTTSFLTVYPDGTSRPTTSNLNFTKGQTISNLVTVPVSDGVVDIFNHVGTAHVIADVEGYYTAPVPIDPTSAATSFTPLPPTRILDTRTTTGGHDAVIGAGASATLQVAGTAGIPADATSVVLNLTGVSPTQTTFVTAYPDGTTRPGTSDLNIAAGQTLPNMVVVPIGANGKIDFFNNTGQINVVADVTGYFAD